MTSDRYAWALETAEAVRAGDLDRIDRTTLAEELEQLSRADRRELNSLTKRIIEHLIKVRYLGGMNVPHWRGEIMEFQFELDGLLEDSPSLKTKLTGEMLQDIYTRTIRRLAAQYGRKLLRDAPKECPFSRNDILKKSK